MIVVDVETSGLNPELSSLVSIGAVNFEDRTQEFYEECKVFDGAEIDPKGLELNGYSENQIADPKKQSEAELIKNFSKWVSEQNNTLQKTNGYDHVIGAQAAYFDVSFLQAACKRAGINYMFGRRSVDLHAVSYAHHLAHGKPLPIKDGQVSLSLNATLEYLGLEPEPNPHIAITGARLEAEAFSRLIFGSK